uniref:CUB domain-containing protein n=1 Tax=Romanomermis culicivorax TaxID=13658 RepID=A0A915J3H9_ROMCU
MEAVAYHCDKKSTTVNEPCLHNGYRDKLCSCVCPYGFSGDLCQFLKYHYRYNAPECGPVILSEKNAEDDGDHSFFTLSSPNFPSQYPRNLFCQWYVETDRATKLMKLTFNFLDLEYEDVVRTGEKCADKLYVFLHGTDVDTSQIPCQPKDNEKLIGSTFETQQNWLLVEFRTDPWGQHKHHGFNISIQVIDTMAESSTDMPAVIDIKIETILRNFTEFLTNQIAKNRLICYRCDNATHCEKDAQNSVTCELGEACAYQINVDDELDWRGCSTMELCADGWRNSLLDVEGDNEYWDIFRCCGESYCNFIEAENCTTSHATQKLCLLLIFVLLFNNSI